MSDFKFNCPYCQQHLQAGDEILGQEISCPSCNGRIQVPGVSPAPPMIPQAAPAQAILPPQPAAGTMFCPQCGEKNMGNNNYCVRCGFMMHSPSQPQHVASANGTMGRWIPYKNPKALWAYYLGMFSVIPIIGFPLAIAATIMGVTGLKYAKKYPEAKGKAHAWTGIVLGSLVLAGYFLFLVAILVNR